MDNLTALLRAIMHHPDEDTPRLSLADWLGENPRTERVKCPRCNSTGGYQQTVCTACEQPVEFQKTYEQGVLRTAPACPSHGWRSPVGVRKKGDCARCHGTGTVPDDTHELWAELIRVQVEIETLRCPECRGGHCVAMWAPGKVCVTHEERLGFLRTREHELTAALDARLAAPCQPCKGQGRGHYGLEDTYWECEVCDGTGDLLNERNEWGHVPASRSREWHRGFCHVHCTLAEVCRPNPNGFDRRGPDVGVDWSNRNGFPCTCHWSSSFHGDECPEHGKRGVDISGGEPTPWAVALPADVVGLWVTDLTPDVEFSTVTKRDGWHWKNHRELKFLFPHLKMSELHPTHDHARLALAHALRLWIYGFQTPLPVTT